LKKKGKILTAKLDKNTFASGIFKSVMGAFMADPKGSSPKRHSNQKNHPTNKLVRMVSIFILI